MSSRLVSRLVIVTPLCVALLWVWVAGAHIHRCLDGLDAPSTVHHLADGDAHSGHHVPESEHSDVDVEFDTSLGRAAKNAVDAPMISLEIGFSRLEPVARRSLALASSPALPATRFLQPPLRAPPA